MAEALEGGSRLSLRQLFWIAVATLIVIFLVSTAFSLAARVTVANAVNELNRSAIPARIDVTALTRSYVDQETGQRGFLLTGEPVFLEPFVAGREAEQALIAEIRQGIGHDETAMARLDAVMRVAGAWRQFAETEIDARRAGPLDAERLQEVTRRGKELFDELRSELASLDARAGELIAGQLSRVHTAQRIANIAQGTAVGLMLAMTVIAAVLIRRYLTRPVDTVLGEVRAVTKGNFDHPIFPRGPREISELAEAVEGMRDNLRASTKRLVEAERRDEQARLAADLHGRTIRRVFALSLSLTSATARGNRQLRALVDETDDIIRDLQAIIFNLDESVGDNPSEDLRSAILDVIDESAAALGFTPSLRFSGPIESVGGDIEVHAAALAAVREALGLLVAVGAPSASLNVVAADYRLGIEIGTDWLGEPDDPLVSGSVERLRRLGPGQRTEVTVAQPPSARFLTWAVALEH